MKRRDRFDVEPRRVLGRALTQWAQYPAEDMQGFEQVIRRGGAGVATSEAEMLGFKYLINIHGNGNEWSNRFPSLLSCCMYMNICIYVYMYIYVYMHRYTCAYIHTGSGRC